MNTAPRITRLQVLLFFLLIVLSGCTYRSSGTYFRDGIAQYHGEGSIRDVSQRSGLVSARGYVIEFDKFDLGGAYDKQFRLTNLPTITNSRVQISLAVEDEEISRSSLDSVDSLRKKLEGRLTISVIDSTGITMTGFTSNIGNLIWSSPVHGYAGYWLYDLNRSFFNPRPGEIYSLHVQYLPDATLKGKLGCIYLYSGCGGS